MIHTLFNPFLKRKSFSNISSESFIIKSDISLTTAILLLFSLTVISYILFWIFCNEIIVNNIDGVDSIKNFSLFSGVLSFVIAFFSYYKMGLSPLLAPLYAIFSGIFISGLSFVAEIKFPGIAFLTVEITLLTFIIVYLGYKYGIIKVTKKFKSIVYAMIGVVSALYMLSFIFIFFDINIPLIHDAGIGGIAWSLFIMITVSFHLAIDIDKVENYKISKGYMNWNLALGLMVSLIWLYISTLRLLSRINKLK